MPEIPETLLEAALAYAAMGLPVFPCAPRGKKPITQNGFHDATADEAMIRRWWQATPQANIGMATGTPSGLIVIDIDPRHGGDESVEHLQVHHGKLPPTAESLTGSKGRHLFFQHPGDRVACSQSKLAPGIDIKGDGGYVILPPSLHPNGGHYVWELSSDIGVTGPAPCPEWLAPLIRADSAAAPSPPAGTSAQANDIPEGHRNGTLARLAGGMRRNGMSREEILGALLVTNRNRCRPPLPDAEVESIAASVARYEPDAVSVAVAEDHYSQMFEDNTPEEAAARPHGDDPGPLPESVLRVPGLVSEVMDLTLSTAAYPSLTSAFCGAVALQSFLCARKVSDPGDIRSNVYLLTLASSSSGKDQPRQVNAKILSLAGMADCLGNKFASGEGIQDSLFLTPAMLYQTDEIDDMLQVISRSKDARWEGVMSTLLIMYSNSPGLFPTRRKAGQQKATFIDQPSLTLYGTACPSHYYKALCERMLTNGFFARMIILEAGKRPEGQESKIIRIGEQIAETVAWWRDFQPGEHRANLVDIHPVPKIVDHSDDARRLLTDLRKQTEQEYAKAEDKMDEVGMTVWGRVCENARKLALIYACSEDHKEPVISADAIRWAAALTTHQARRMLYMAARYVSDGDFEARCMELLGLLGDWRAKHGEAWMPFWQVSRRFKWSPRLHEEVREALLNSKEIEYREVLNGGRPARQYRLH